MLRSADQLSREGAFYRCPQDKGTVRGLLEAAQRKALDAQIENNSLDTRVEANYDVCLNIALAVLNAEGWKGKSAEGHHKFALEAACSAIGASQGLYDKVDAIRDLRNLKYAGVSRTVKDLGFSKEAQEEFSCLAIAWLQNTHQQLLKP